MEPTVLGHSATADEPTAVKLAFGALTLFQSYVQQADAKVNTLLLVHTGGVVAAVAALGSRGGLHWTLVSALLLAAFAVAVIGSGYHIIQALRPRTHAPAEPNPFGITGAGSVPATEPAEQGRQCWEMARLLGEIALIKNRHIQRATPWTALLLLLGLAAAVIGV